MEVFIFESKHNGLYTVCDWEQYKGKVKTYLCRNRKDFEQWFRYDNDLQHKRIVFNYLATI